MGVMMMTFPVMVVMMVMPLVWEGVSCVRGDLLIRTGCESSIFMSGGVTFSRRKRSLSPSGAHHPAHSTGRSQLPHTNTHTQGSHPRLESNKKRSLAQEIILLGE
jgi:hypothetical protein